MTRSATVFEIANIASGRAEAVTSQLERYPFAIFLPALTNPETKPKPGWCAYISFPLQRNRVGDIWDLALETDVRSPGTQLEVARVPDYMDSDNDATAEYLLNYELWDALSVDIREPMDVGGITPGILTVNLYQRHPLLIALEPLARGELRDAGEDDELALGAFYSIESHYPLYMEDMNW